MKRTYKKRERVHYKELKHFNGLITRSKTRYLVHTIGKAVTTLICYDDPNKKSYLMNTDMLLTWIMQRQIKPIFLNEEEVKHDHD